MGTLTYSFTVQLYPDGSMSYHSWRARYAPGGRQLPEHRASGDIPDAAYLSYLAGELVDDVVRQRVAWQRQDAQQPLDL